MVGGVLALCLVIGMLYLTAFEDKDIVLMSQNVLLFCSELSL